jgi:hypothetical protein
MESVCNIKFYRYVTEYGMVNNFSRFEGRYCLHLQDQVLQVVLLTLDMNVLESFEASVTIYLSTRHNIPQAVIFVVLQCCYFEHSHSSHFIIAKWREFTGFLLAYPLLTQTS